MKNVPLLIGTILGTLAIVIAVAFFFSGDGQTEESMPVEVSLLTEGVTHKVASESASVTVVEFSDFQCPACKASEPFVEELLATYPDEVAFYYRHFPLDQIHANARAAARASEAVAQQDKFWEFHHLLFEKQEEWSDITDRDELLTLFSGYAQAAGVEDIDAFKQAYEQDESVSQVVVRDAELARELNLSGTPTFFVEGVNVSAPELLTTVATILQEKSSEE